MLTMTRNTAVIIGHSSTVNLLPPEIVAKRKLRIFRRRMIFVLIILLFVIIGCVSLVGAQALQAEKDLAIAQTNAAYLQSQQNIFSAVHVVQNEVDSIRAAQQVGDATEINWQSFLRDLLSTLPKKVILETIIIDQATPFAPYTQPSAPLQGARIATISFTATTPTLPQVPLWLNEISRLPGFADANPGSVVRNESGSYSVSITIHINQSAFSHRFSISGVSK